jgi:hypothetical protein
MNARWKHPDYDAYVRGISDCNVRDHRNGKRRRGVLERPENIDRWGSKKFDVRPTVSVI